ncbi:MAG: CDP-diacylglycerol--serine O-phosphatidyltransferase [Holosporales bacterium]|nr:CDP-diacylglycerol--serine O-phosphatidyltransferase [Holosporales bacterium]
MRRKPLAFVPVSRIVPNTITLISLCLGFSSIRFALAAGWKYSVACIIGAAILDGTDGRVARLLNSSSQLGAELDSLADFVAFGASPALVLYLFSVNASGAYGWVVCLFYLVCSILRLARFNIQTLDAATPSWEKKFFTGVPITFAAIIAVVPIMLEFECSLGLFNHPLFCSVFMLLSGSLMISRIKTFSFKTIQIPHKFMLPVMLIAGFVVAVFVTIPWLTMLIIVAAYLLMIPISVNRHRKLAAASEVSI